MWRGVFIEKATPSQSLFIHLHIQSSSYLTHKWLCKIMVFATILFYVLYQVLWLLTVFGYVGGRRLKTEDSEELENAATITTTSAIRITPSPNVTGSWVDTLDDISHQLLPGPKADYSDDTEFEEAPG